MPLMSRFEFPMFKLRPREKRTPSGAIRGDLVRGWMVGWQFFQLNIPIGDRGPSSCKSEVTFPGPGSDSAGNLLSVHPHHDRSSTAFQPVAVPQTVKHDVGPNRACFNGSIAYRGESGMQHRAFYAPRERAAHGRECITMDN